MTRKYLLSLFCTALITISCFAQNTPKYVFLFIGDGMSLNDITATENYLAWKQGKNYGGPRLRMRTFPVMGTADTYCANNLVTCSAAAGTAIACGHKTKKGYEGMDENGNSIPSVATILHERGYNIGILTNEPVNHATPAAFYSHVTSRSHFGTMVQQIPASGFEIIAGDGFIDDKRDEFKDFNAVDHVQKNGYKVCYGPSELQQCPKGEKVCFFQPSSRTSASEITAEMDEKKTYNVKQADEGDMTLQQMFDASLERLGDEKPFFIMCEGGDIDHGAHVNFLMKVVNEILEFDKAIGSALEFYKKHPDETLIIVTSDHETGGMIIGGGKSTVKGNWIDWATLEEDYNNNKTRKSSDQEKCRELSRNSNINWSTYSHSACNVPVFAIGKNSQRFSNAMDNTEFFAKILW